MPYQYDVGLERFYFFGFQIRFGSTFSAYSKIELLNLYLGMKTEAEWTGEALLITDQLFYYQP